VTIAYWKMIVNNNNSTLYKNSLSLSPSLPKRRPTVEWCSWHHRRFCFATTERLARRQRHSVLRLDESADRSDAVTAELR